MRQLGYDTYVKTRRPNFDTKTKVMTKKKPVVSLVELSKKIA